jgi:hypothetical protein
MFSRYLTSLALSLTITVAPILNIFSSKSVIAQGPSKEYVDRMNSSGASYEKLVKYLESEMPSTFNKNIEAHIKLNNSRGSHGSSLEGFNKSEMAKTITLSSGNPSDAYQALRIAYGVDADFDKSDKKNQKLLYYIKLNNMMYDYKTKGVLPESKYHIILNQRYGFVIPSKTKFRSSQPELDGEGIPDDEEEEVEVKTKKSEYSKLIEEYEKQVDKELDLLSHSEAINNLYERLKNSNIVDLDIDRWLDTTFKYEYVQDAGLNYNDYLKLREKVKIKVQEVLNDNKTKSVNIIGELGEASVNYFSSNISGITITSFSAVKFITLQANESDKQLLAGFTATYGTGLAGCAIGTILIPVGGPLGCIAGAYLSTKLTQYTIESFQRQELFNPFEQGNREILCGKKESTLTKCFINGFYDLGIDALTSTAGKVPGKLLAPATFKNKNLNKLSSCAKDNSLENQIHIFDPNAIADLDEDGNPLEINAKACPRPLRQGIIKDPGNEIKAKINGKEDTYLAKAYLVNDNKVKNQLEVSLSKDTLEHFNDQKKITKNVEKYRTLKKGSFQFDHIIAVNELLYNGFTTEAITGALKLIAEDLGDTKYLEVNNPSMTRFVDANVNRLYNVILRQEKIKLIQQGKKDNPKAVLEAIKNANDKLARYIKANPSEFNSIYRFDTEDNILLKSKYFKGIEQIPNL